MSYADIFEPRQPIQKPFLASIALHASLTAAVLGWGFWTRRNADIGKNDGNPGPGFVTTVETLPMPARRGVTNPVANDSESQAPAQPRPAVRVEPDDPDAIALDKPKKKKITEKKKAVESVPYRPKRDYDPYQVYSTKGPQLTTPMFQVKGGGGVGFGTGSPFGTRLGWYADLVRQRIGEKWRTQDIDSHVTTAPIISITFEIQRNGQVTNARIFQRSGNYALDASALRAVQEASPLPALPPEFERKSASVEFNFQFQR